MRSGRIVRLQGRDRCALIESDRSSVLNLGGAMPCCFLDFDRECPGHLPDTSCQTGDTFGDTLYRKSMQSSASPCCGKLAICLPLPIELRGVYALSHRTSRGGVFAVMRESSDVEML